MTDQIFAAPTTLDDLLEVLRAQPAEGSDTYARERGLPVANGQLDMASLPTYGGVEPRSTHGVWSWDATRLLVGDGTADLQIVLRDDA